MRAFATILAVAALAFACSSANGNHLASVAGSTSIDGAFAILSQAHTSFDLAAYRRQSPLVLFERSVKSATDAKVEIGPYLWRGTRTALEGRRSAMTDFADKYPTMGAYLDEKKIDAQAALTRADFEQSLKAIQTAFNQNVSLALQQSVAEQNVQCHDQQKQVAYQRGCIAADSKGKLPDLDAAALSCVSDQGQVLSDCDVKFPVQNLQRNTFNCTDSARCRNGLQSNGGVNFVPPPAGLGQSGNMGAGQNSSTP